MAGIISYGAYIPLWWLARDAIADAWGSGSIRGEGSVANNDGDTITWYITDFGWFPSGSWSSSPALRILSGNTNRLPKTQPKNTKKRDYWWTAEVIR
jgi:hypothetical protein